MSAAEPFWPLHPIAGRLVTPDGKVWWHVPQCEDFGPGPWYSTGPGEGYASVADLAARGAVVDDGR